jgi:hypothetical protein
MKRVTNVRYHGRKTKRGVVPVRQHQRNLIYTPEELIRHQLTSKYLLPLFLSGIAMTTAMTDTQRKIAKKVFGKNIMNIWKDFYVKKRGVPEDVYNKSARIILKEEGYL